MAILERAHEVIVSKLGAGVACLCLAAAAWFGWDWLLEDCLGVDAKVVFLGGISLRPVIAGVLGLAGLILAGSALTD
jgi:hypothetical protein